MNINAVISQRLKLATKDLSRNNADLETVLLRVMMQDRLMTLDEVADEDMAIRALYHKSRVAFQHLNADPNDFFKEKLLSMHPSQEQLTHLTVRAAEQVLQYNSAGNVHPDGFLPEDFRLELHHLVEVNKQGNAGKIPQEAMLDMLSNCLMLLSMLGLKDSRIQLETEQQAQETDSTVEDEMAVKSLTALRDEGKLPDYWANVTDEQIGQLRDFVLKDEMILKSSKEINQKWLDALMMEYAQTRSENAADVFETSEADIEARHLLSIAVIRNLKATGKLTGGMEKMSDEDLALAAYIGTEMNYYFDEAAAGKLSFEDYWHLVSGLFLGAFTLFIAYLLLLPPFSLLQAILAAVIGLCSLFHLCDAVSQFLNELFPAGVSETRLGVAVKAKAQEVIHFAAVMFDKLTGRSYHADSLDDGVYAAEDDYEYEDDDCEYEDGEYEDEEFEHGGFEPLADWSLIG